MNLLETYFAAQSGDAEAMQAMIDSGACWHLEGSFGRQAMSMIEAGECILGPEPARDYYGNLIPARDQVAPGTLGSVEYAARLQELV